ncbi:hypothetical protein EYW49_16610 [Siculibacillus lacustris]|uniref:Terminase n=1 Tax=Siculibacillus lacustris TaxID=1549641 RepID=A0A4V2KT04_9HYPH|nr:terminase gpA endonuclease subunit [Siculibacillus lacustris]TBW35071.1 hypothetical protein EYW49_16610 [Siculibacillus lacustris]
MTVHLRTDDASDLERAFRAALAPLTPPDALAWTTAAFRLSPKDSAAPGLVSWEPWQTEVLQAFADPAISQVAVCASSQTGKTLIGLALLNYAARHRPGPVLYLHETEVSAQSFAKDRIEPSLEVNSSDITLGRRTQAGNTTTRKEFTSGAIVNIVGANSPGSLSGRPAATLLATEARGYPTSAGREGDPLSLALARLKSFPNSKAFIESSPGVKGRCRLTEAVEQGDARRFHVKCPSCGHEAPVLFDAAPGSHHIAYSLKQPDTSGIACCDCGSLWTARERLDAIRHGYFKATREAIDPTVASFYYSELVSPRSTIADIVRRYAAARLHPERLHSFTNTCLGEVYDPDQATVSIDPEDLAARAENYDANSLLPEGVLVVTAGIDTQPDRLEVQILGHGENNRRWSLDYAVIRGNPNGPTPWMELEKLLSTKEYQHPFGGMVRIASACIDSGGANTQAVSDFCAQNLARGRNWFAIKGQGGEGRVIVKKSSVYLKRGDPYKLVIVGVDTAKSEIFGSINGDVDLDEATLTFPSKYPPAFFAGITSERQRITTDKLGRVKREFIHVDKAIRNEPLDTLVYAIAAFHLISPKPDFKSIAFRLVHHDDKPADTIAAKAARIAKLMEAA